MCQKIIPFYADTNIFSYKVTTIVITTPPVGPPGHGRQSKGKRPWMLGKTDNANERDKLNIIVALMF